MNSYGVMNYLNTKKNTLNVGLEKFGTLQTDSLASKLDSRKEKFVTDKRKEAVIRLLCACGESLVLHAVTRGSMSVYPCPKCHEKPYQELPSDPESRDDPSDFLNAWFSKFGHELVTTEQLLPLALETQVGVRGHDDSSKKRSLSWYMRTQVGRSFGGFVVHQTNRQDEANRVFWMLKDVEKT